MEEIGRNYKAYVEQSEQDHFRISYNGEFPKRDLMQRESNLSWDDISEVIFYEGEFADNFYNGVKLI